MVAGVAQILGGEGWGVGVGARYCVTDVWFGVECGFECGFAFGPVLRMLVLGRFQLEFEFELYLPLLLLL